MRLSILFLSVFGLFQTAAAQQIGSAKLKATGLTCSMCSKAVYTALTKAPNVAEVKSNIQTSEYTVTFKKGSKPNPDALVKAVENAGFSVGELSLQADMNGQKVANDTHLTLDGRQYHFVKVSSQTLKGPVTLKLLDKRFAGKKVHNEYAGATKMPCYHTGVMKSCCPADEAIADNKTIFHVTL